MRGRRSFLVAAAAAALAAAGCGGAAAAGTSGAATSHPAGSAPANSLGTLKSVTVVPAGPHSQLRRYLRQLAPMCEQVRLANRAAAHEASIASSGDYAALAADSRAVKARLGRAAAAARRVPAPQGLEGPHANLVRSLVTGQRMAGRLAALYEHIGPESKREYRHQVLPLEKRSLRLANLWYAFMQGAMAAENVDEPGWMGHLFDWT